MIKKLNLNNTETVKNILELQKASYRIEAKLIGSYDIPPLRDTIESLKKSDEIFYGYYVESVLAGVISYKRIDDVLNIHRLAIKPRFFHIGIAGKLISFVEELENSISKAVICTGKENTPAVNLYLKNGYKKVKDIEISEGIYLTQFEKTIDNK